ncbi:MAG: PorV/PorQ family protein [candidate division Zixibacteria bacterium]|nr:PorV/PorQ family protein [candidate division Zixibacteria bacterium]
MKKHMYIIVLLLVCAGQSAFAEAEDGGYAGSFLKMAVQARPAAMGGAYYGLSNDAAGQLFNPAGLTEINKVTVASSYRVMDLDRKLGLISVLVPTRLQSTLGISWLYAGYGEVMARNSSGRELGRTISDNEHVFGATFSKQFLPAFSMGVKLNYLYKKLDVVSANSIGINGGAMLLIDSLFEYGTMEDKPITDIHVGIVVKNLGAKYSWTTNKYWDQYGGTGATQDDKFPVMLGAGVSARMFQKDLLVLVDVEKNFEQALVARFGGEYTLRDRYFLRGGLNEGIITAGFGFLQEFENFAFCFDYAFSADRVDEGSDHIVSLNVMF